MKRLLITIILVILAFFAGAHIGRDGLKDYSLTGGKKAISLTKTSCQWIISQCQAIEDKDA